MLVADVLQKRNTGRFLLERYNYRDSQNYQCDIQCFLFNIELPKIVLRNLIYD